MDALGLGDVIALATLTWLLGIALGGAGYWLAVAWLDRAAHRSWVGGGR